MASLYKMLCRGSYISYKKKQNKKASEFRPLFIKELLGLLVLALLVSNAAAGLASGLARGLALAAATVLCAVAKVTSLDSFDMLHYSILQRISFYDSIIQLLS